MTLYLCCGTPAATTREKSAETGEKRQKTRILSPSLAQNAVDVGDTCVAISGTAGVGARERFFFHGVTRQIAANMCR